MEQVAESFSLLVERSTRELVILDKLMNWVVEGLGPSSYMWKLGRSGKKRKIRDNKGSTQTDRARAKIKAGRHCDQSRTV